MPTRTLREIRADRQGIATLRNLVSALDAKLELASRFGVYEYEAAEDGHERCSETFRDMAAAERGQITELLELLCGSRRATGARQGAVHLVQDDRGETTT